MQWRCRRNFGSWCIFPEKILNLFSNGNDSSIYIAQMRKINFWIGKELLISDTKLFDFTAYFPKLNFYFWFYLIFVYFSEISCILMVFFYSGRDILWIFGEKLREWCTVSLEIKGVYLVFVFLAFFGEKMRRCLDVARAVKKIGIPIRNIHTKQKIL